MDSQSIVADVITAFARFNLSTAELYRRLNRSCEHYLKSDVYTDLFTVVETTTTTGHITIPRQFGRVYGVQEEKCAKPVFGQWLEFIEYGVGRQDPAEMCLDGLIDMGNHFVTQSDVWSNGQQVPGTLRIKITNSADAGKTVRFDGTSDGINRIFDSTGMLGESVTTVNPSVNSTKTYQTIDGIQTGLGAAGFVAPWTLWKVISGVETQIGSYEPGEARPRYVRYKTRLTTQRIRLFCRRRHVLLTSSTNWVYPDNMDAHEHGFNACMWRDKGDMKAEAEAWEAGKKVLKDEYYSITPTPRTFLTSEGYEHGRRIW